MVFVGKAFDVEEKEVNLPGVENTTIRWLISRKSGAENFAMRLFTLGKSGHTPLHSHDFEHEIFVLQGKGELYTENGSYSLEKYSFAFVEANVKHQFINKGDSEFRFLCLVPDKAY